MGKIHVTQIKTSGRNKEAIEQTVCRFRLRKETKWDHKVGY